MTPAAGFSWPDTLHKLSRREDLSADEAGAALGQVMEGLATPAQIAAFLVGLRTKGETPSEMVGLVRTMLFFATPLDVAGPLIDTCGTGGDRAGTINISTLAALVVAGAGGRVAKHGNRAASSLCGSADLLEALGVTIDLGPEEVAHCIAEAGVGFCFAPRFHPAMRHAGPVRKELGIPTIMNFLGPLSNPARAEAQVVGVSDPAMAPKMVEVLRGLAKKRAMVVHGLDGLDEITTTTRTLVHELEGDDVRVYEIDPADLGLAVAAPDTLRGGDVRRNQAVAEEVLAGRRGPARDVVALNAAAGCVVGGLAGDLREGLDLAFAVLDDGRAASAIEVLAAASRAAGVT